MTKFNTESLVGRLAEDFVDTLEIELEEQNDYDKVLLSTMVLTKVLEFIVTFWAPDVDE